MQNATITPHTMVVILHHFFALEEDSSASAVWPLLRADFTFSAFSRAGIPVGQNMKMDTIAHVRWLFMLFVDISFFLSFVLLICGGNAEREVAIPVALRFDLCITLTMIWPAIPLLR